MTDTNHQKALQILKSLPMGTLKMLMKDVPDTLALAPWAVTAAPEGATRVANKLFGTPVWDYDASQLSGYNAVTNATDHGVEYLRAMLNQPEPEAFSPEYFGELAGGLTIPAGPVAALMAKLGKVGKVLGPISDFAVAPYTKTGKAATAGLYMAPDIINQARASQ